MLSKKLARICVFILVFIISQPVVSQYDNKYIVTKKYLNKSVPSIFRDFEKSFNVKLIFAMVKRIYTNSYHVPATNQKSSVARSFYIPSYIVHPVEFEELPNFEEITANLLPTVRFRLKKEKYILSFYIKDFEKVFTEGVGIFLNGIPFSNLEYIASLSSLDIDRIEVCNKQVMHGDITYNGIVSIYTFDPSVQPSVIKNPFLFDDNRTNSTSTDQTELHGLPGNSPIDNYLYWNPDIILRGNESIELEFKTFNLESEYRMQINGISDSGIPFNKIVDFKVQ
jgi:hypothetical protein